MNTGKIVLIEELNSIFDGELEKWLNQALTGIDPSTGTPVTTQGFYLIATINGAHISGRQCFSPALLARCNHINMSATTAADVEAILSYHNITSPQTKKVIMQEKNLNLRDISQWIENINKPDQETALSQAGLFGRSSTPPQPSIISQPKHQPSL